MFERKVTIDGAVVLLKFRPYSEIPGRISRIFTGRPERQLWEALAWGLVEPQRWPDKPYADGEELPELIKSGKAKSTAIADGMLDEVSMSEVMKIHEAWQEYAGVTEGESDASNT